MPFDRDQITLKASSRFARILALLAVCLVSVSAPAQVLEKEPLQETIGVGIDDHAGQKLPLDAVFTNSKGERVPLSTYFDGTVPAIVVFVYYDCPVVCPTVLSMVSESVDELDFTTGEDFNLLVFSFDPSETTEQAAASRTNWMSRYQRASDPKVAQGWAWHTGDAVAIRKLADAMGWKFKPLDNGDYSHPVGIVVASPDGMVSRYFYGFDYPAKQLKLSLLDATDGKIAKSIGDQIMHYCFSWDPNAGTYSVEAMAVMRIAGVITVIFLVFFIGALFLAERVRRNHRAGKGPKDGHGSEEVDSAGKSVSHA